MTDAEQAPRVERMSDVEWNAWEPLCSPHDPLLVAQIERLRAEATRARASELEWKAKWRALLEAAPPRETKP